MRVGPAQRLRALLPACGRIGALAALPLLAGPAVAPPARILAPLLPWIGQPDLYGGGAYALGGPAYGFGNAGYAGGFSSPGYAFAPLEGYGPQPGGRQPIAQSYQASAGGQAPGATQPDVSHATAPPARAAANHPALPTTPQPVPCPPGAAVLAVALLGATALRKTERRLTGTAVPASRATSNHGATHA